MSPTADYGAPKRCLYCEGDDPICGFCEMGIPLDAQEDWDNSWGRLFKNLREQRASPDDGSRA